MGDRQPRDARQPSRMPSPRRRRPTPPPRHPASTLAPDERAAVTEAVRRANPRLPEPLLAFAMEWAHAVRLQSLILDRVLAGEVDILPSHDGADLTFRSHRSNVLPFASLARARRAHE
jgi:hypothetical protein